MTEPDRFHPTSFTTITVEIDEAAKVAVVTLDRPEAYNAFSPTMQEELKSTWRAFRSDDRVNAIVLTAAGDTSFCVGIDRNEAEFTNMAGDSRLYGTSNNFMYDDPGDDLGPKSCDLWKPVICAVNGMACGGAFYMLAESDIIIVNHHLFFADLALRQDDFGSIIPDYQAVIFDEAHEVESIAGEDTVPSASFALLALLPPTCLFFSTTTTAAASAATATSAPTTPPASAPAEPPEDAEEPLPLLPVPSPSVPSSL